MSEYLYNDDSPVIADADWCAHRIVKVEGRTRTFLETLDVYSHLQKVVDRRVKANIAGIAVRWDLADTEEMPGYWGPRQGLLPSVLKPQTSFWKGQSPGHRLEDAAHAFTE